MQEPRHREEAGAEKILNFSRLQEEHAKAIKLSKERIDKWAQFRADYEALQAKMYTLPDKLSHDIMVPFGKFAFMPGQLYDTNEVMVLLGDNWFIKRSVKQALEIAERRKQNVTKMLEDEKKQMSEWEARHAFASSFRNTMEEHENTVEIKEDYDEDKERKRKERRQRNIKSGYVPPPRPAFPKASSTHPSFHAKPTRSHDEPRSSTDSPSTKSKQTGREQKAKLEVGEGITDTRETEKSVEELWARLDELEKEEKEYLAHKKEEEDDDDDDEKAAMAVKSDKEKWTAERKTSKERDEKVMAMTKKAKKVPVKSTGVSTVATPPLKITVRHTSSQLDASTEIKEEDTVDKEQEKDNALFGSPADIFYRFCKPESSDEDSPRQEEGTSKRESKAVAPPTSSPSSVGKGVTWNPTLVEFSDGSKASSEIRGAKKSEQAAKRGRGRGTTGSGGGNRRGNSGSGKKPSKPPMPFSGQVIERFAPIQPVTSHDRDGGAKKVSKFKASRKQ